MLATVQVIRVNGKFSWGYQSVGRFSLSDLLLLSNVVEAQNPYSS